MVYVSLSLSLNLFRSQIHSAKSFANMALVGVLALQGSFNEHIAGTSSLSLSLSLTHTSHTVLCVCSISLFLFMVSALRRLGVKGVEIRKPAQLDSVASLIIPGGESTTMAKLAEYHNLVLSLTLYIFYFQKMFLAEVQSNNAKNSIG